MRRRRSLRDYVLLVWLVGAVAVALAHRWVPEATWLLVHLVALGALSHSVMVWTAHFSAALLKTRTDDATRRQADLRLGLLAGGSLAVFVGVPTAQWWLVVAGASAVSAAVLWHAAVLVRDLRRALPGRFRVCVRYYVAAAICLPVGAGFGATLALGLDDRWHAALLIAHTMTMLLGWIGLTVVGTLVTFWPTVLRTRMDDRAERLAKQILPVLIGALAVVIAGALIGVRPLVVVGLAGYAAALVWWGRSLVGPLRAKPPREFAPASILAAGVWACVAIVATAYHVAVTDDVELARGYPMLASIWVVGFLLQLVTGALSYLLPSVIGGGPRVVRAGAAQFDRYASARLSVINGGLVAWLLPLPSWAAVTVSSAVLVALAAFIPLMLAGIRASVAERRRMIAGEPAGPADRPNAFTANGVVAGVAALTLALTLGFGLDPATSAPAGGTAAGVAATGETVRVRLAALDMQFEPSSIQVRPGDRVVIELTNEDPTTVHDLAIGDARTPRLAPGESAELDLGVVGGPLSGWCTVVGHKQMGMTFEVVVEGSPAPAAGPTTEESDHSHDTADTTAELSGVVDPVAPPLTAETVRRYELRVTEVPLEVAPGVWQRRWTFNGASVGPTLRGRVGDTFEITLINDGTMGHSIDFHASALSPEHPMRTIAPGERLTYRFTAQRAGVWMYHCSTMPMSAHIAAGMHGAVIIEPEEGLPEVDREYVLVQSEVFMAEEATGAETATDLDADAVLGEHPTRVVFNGVANQYDQVPLAARVGERVRFWVLDAGPNRTSSFHIVGAQFDTVYREGGYLLKQGTDPFGGTGGGAQVLALTPAEGGFVELEFPDPGRYPVVSHVMVDAERGAHGYVEVS